MKKFTLLIFFLLSFIYGTKRYAPDPIVKSKSIQTERYMYSADLQSVVDEFCSDDLLENATTGISIFDLSTRTFVAEHNPLTSLIPASVMKIITTVAALEILGPDSFFETKMGYSGIIDKTNKVLNGDIIVKGGGDPCLGSSAFKNYYFNPDFISLWVAKIQAEGVASINGNIIADASVFDEESTPPGWNWIDIPAYYGTPAFGLSIYDNQFVLNFNPSRKGRYLVHQDSMNPVIPDLYAENLIRADNREDKYLDFIGSYYSNQRIIKGNLTKIANTLELKGSIPDPPYLLASQLKNELQKAGIKINGHVLTSRIYRSENKPLPQEIKYLSSVRSPTVAEIVRRTNMFSVNLYAEHLLTHIGYIRNNLGSTLSGTKALLSFYKSKGKDTKGIFFADGSGLSRENLLTARFIVQILADSYGISDIQQAFYLSLPVSGVSGTLRSFCNGTVAEGKIHAKSGTMARVKSYAGYIQTSSGKTLAFAVMLNNFSCTSQQIQALLTKLMVNIYNAY